MGLWLSLVELRLSTRRHVACRALKRTISRSFRSVYAPATLGLDTSARSELEHPRSEARRITLKSNLSSASGGASI